MILSFSWIPSPARAHEKKKWSGITFSAVCVSTPTRFLKNNTDSVRNTTKHYVQEKEETQSFTTVPVSLENSNGARRKVYLKITTRICVIRLFFVFELKLQQMNLPQQVFNEYRTEGWLIVQIYAKKSRKWGVTQNQVVILKQTVLRAPLKLSSETGTVVKLCVSSFSCA